MYRILLAATMVTVAAPSLLGAQDTLVVHSNGSPAWGSAPRLVEELRIGVLEGAEEELFGSVFLGINVMVLCKQIDSFL